MALDGDSCRQHPKQREKVLQTLTKTRLSGGWEDAVGGMKFEV